MKNEELLEVAVAIIEQDGRVLIAQRRADDSFAGCWEFPGGKANPGETLEACLIREIQEELGVAIEIRRKFQVVEHRYPTRNIRLHGFLCRLVSGQPRAIECAAWEWVDPKDLSRFRLPPANGPIVEKLQKGEGL